MIYTETDVAVCIAFSMIRACIPAAQVISFSVLESIS